MSHPLKNRSFLFLTASQFLGAFNDNAFKQFILLLAVSIQLARPEELEWLPLDPQALASAAFAAPFVLFGILAGSLADRVAKRQIIVFLNCTEILVMVLGTVAFALALISLSHAVVAAMIVLFLMGTQSAFFGPSKYGSIPEMVDETELSRANGIVSGTTQVAIVLGVVAAGLVSDSLRKLELGPHFSGIFFVSVAVVGMLFSLGIRKVPAADPERRLDLNVAALPFHLGRELRRLRGDRDLVLAIFGVGWFFLVGACALPAINLFGKETLGLSDSGTSFLLMWPTLGIAAGSFLAMILSGRRVELGLVLIGAAGYGFGFFLIDLLPPGAGTGSLALFVAGLFGGLYLVPLLTFIQQRPDPADKGRVLGLEEFVSFSFIFLSAGVFELLKRFGLNPVGILTALGWLAILGGALLGFLSTSFLRRTVAWIISNAIYRMKILHPERIPGHGGALFVCNHVSYADPFLVASAVPRYVRFLMARNFMEMRFLGWGARLLKVIPISDTDPRRELLQSLQAASRHAEEGHLAGIFAEGRITRTGNLLPFSKGLEHIAKRARVPVIPLYLDRMWGSIFSYWGGRFFFKRPLRFPYPVTLAVGEPLPSDASVHEVRQAVQELSADAFEARKRRGRTLATRFLRAGRRYSRRLAMRDHTEKTLTYGQALRAVLALRRLLRRQTPAEKVGVLLPTSNGGALVNLALAVAGRVAVNLNFTAGADAFESAIQQCELDTIITSREFLEKIGRDFDHRMVDLKELIEGMDRWTQAHAAFGSILPAFLLQRLPGVPKDPDETACIVFSSGSTGEPKGVCLSHHNILSNVESVMQVFHLRREDRVVGTLPFFHSFGYTVTIWLPLLHGQGALFHPSPRDPRGVGDLIREHRGTILISTPTFFQIYLRRFEPDDVRTLRMVASGAEKLPRAVAEAWEKRFGMPIYEGYGCTELSPAVAINLPDVFYDDLKQVGHKPGTIGHPLPGVATRIVDPSTGEPVKPSPDREGMLAVKGPIVMMGYLNRPEQTAEVIRDGWYLTGDMARIDEDGFITITGRISRFAKIGGEMVPHLRVEEAIRQVLVAGEKPVAPGGDGDEEVEVAVTSVPDPGKGERLVVLHTPMAATPKEVFSALQSTSLPKLWIPRADAFLEVAEIPKLGSGKIDLCAIQELAAARASSTRQD